VFVNESEVDLVVIANGLAGATWMVFNFQRIKLTNATFDQLGGAGGVIVSAQFQALLKAAGTGYDATTMSIQRSN
jgi:hypothetical protein